MSDLRTLYTKISELSIVYTNEVGSSVTVSGKDLQNVQEEVESLHCPVRLIMPFQSEKGGSGSSMELLTVGTANIFGRITWSVADLYLHAPTGEGFGLHSHMPDLIRYAGAYAEKIADAGADLALGSMTFVGLELQASDIEWPVGSGQHFYGVECVLQYEEILNTG